LAKEHEVYYLKWIGIFYSLHDQNKSDFYGEPAFFQSNQSFLITF